MQWNENKGRMYWDRGGPDQNKMHKRVRERLKISKGRWRKVNKTKEYQKKQNRSEKNPLSVTKNKNKVQSEVKWNQRNEVIKIKHRHQNNSGVKH